MKTLLTLCTAFLLTACACTKNSKPILNEPLPPATQTGANTFGCTLNGQVFVPNKAIGNTMPEFAIRVYGYYENTSNYSKRIYARRGYHPINILWIDIYIYQINLKNVDIYILGNAIAESSTYEQPFNNYILCQAKNKASKWVLYSSYDNSGKITITRWDKDNMILSGTFSGKLKAIEGDEIIEIKDGRFDINLKTLQP